MQKFIVYMHRFPNNKVYVGITSQSDPIRRWGKSGCGYRNQHPIWDAIQKYGWNNIIHEILYTDLSEDDAKQKEIELIQRYQSTNIECGYNISPGGDAVSEITKLKLSAVRTGHIVSDDTRRKIGEANAVALRGRTVPEAVRQKQRVAHLGKKYKPMSEQGRKNIGDSKRGISLTEEHKQKIAEGNRGKSLSEQHRKMLSERMLGTHLSEETRQKLSKSLKASGTVRAKKRAETLQERYPNGLTQSAESNKRRSDALIGRPKSEETRRKMSEARKLSCEAKKLGLTYKEYLNMTRS